MNNFSSHQLDGWRGGGDGDGDDDDGNVDEWLRDGNDDDDGDEDDDENADMNQLLWKTLHIYVTTPATYYKSILYIVCNNGGERRENIYGSVSFKFVYFMRC